MSAEVENNKEEEVKEQRPIRKTTMDLFREQFLLLIKLLELLICAICMGCSYEPVVHEHIAENYLHHVGVMYTAYTGYMVINGVMIISRLIGDRIPFRTASIFAVVGAALFLVTGILLAMVRANILQRYGYSEKMYYIILLQVSIGFSFVNVVIFVADAVLTFRMQDS